MVQINDNYLKLKAGYLFPEISRRVNAFTEKNTDASVIKLGIGDVTQALTPSILKAFHQAVDDLGKENSFKGYGPEQGYEFLRTKVAQNDFKNKGIDICASEIFISDGSKCDTGNIQEIFSLDSVVAVIDPVYPVYVDTNVMAGRTGECNDLGYYEKLVYLPSTAENGFCPDLPKSKVDIIYICSPNNPTGTVFDRVELKKWVDYALENDAIILFDAAYEAFITDDSLPHSIFEIDGSRSCAIEFRSFSKSAGFTGVRCAYTVVPKSLKVKSSKNEKIEIHKLWNRRHCTKFNGVSYPVQRAAEAVYSVSGAKEVKELVEFYLKNAKIIKMTLLEMGFQVFGGTNSPYIWFKTPDKMTSWDFFDHMLERTHVVSTPGSGFGPSGEGYLRLSAFGSRENIEQAMIRIKERI